MSGETSLQGTLRETKEEVGIELDATTDEVVQTKWLTVNEIKELFNQGKLVWTLEYFFTYVAKN